MYMSKTIHESCKHWWYSLISVSVYSENETIKSAEILFIHKHLAEHNEEIASLLLI